MKLVDNILAITPGSGEPISDWFINRLERHIDSGAYPKRATLGTITENLVDQLKQYKESNKIADVVVGMSGGVDSALTAALFKQAGWTVHGVTLPIHQKLEETNRGQENIDALRLEGYNFDLSDNFDSMRDFLGEFESDYKGMQRQGNIRARLRMLTLYNLAHKVGGCVASTDNFSELAAGFWTLHGDVGDVAPIQSLSKSWEVPMLAIEQNVPDSIIKAIPTDGLGVANGDEDQFGFSYMEFDAVLFALIGKIDFSQELPETQELVANVRRRIASTGYKRNNPVNLFHPLDGSTRYSNLESFDNTQIGE